MQRPVNQYHPDATAIGSDQWGELPELLRKLLRNEPVGIVGDWEELLDRAESEGVLPWVAYCQLSGDGFRQAGSAVEERLKKNLRLAASAKLLADVELDRLASAARAEEIPLLVFKGEALARNLYPEPACRQTADFDLIVPPESVPAMQTIALELGYTAERGYYGEHVFAEQLLEFTGPSGYCLFQLDLHWDISNRRFFRQRLPLTELFAEAQTVSLTGSQIAAPSHAHSLLIACVHLAANPPGVQLQLKWLLDIYLLLDVLSESEMNGLTDKAREYGLADVVAFYCSLTQQVLGRGRHAGLVDGLAGETNRFRRRLYGWTCKYRLLDLIEYGLRLPGWVARREFLSQVMAYRNKRRKL